MKDERSGSEILKIDDAARYLGVTRRWVYRRIWSGDLPASKVGGLYFLRKEDLETLLEQGRMGEMAPKAESAKTPVWKCGYCFRILEKDTDMDDVCQAEGCEELICSSCAAEGNHYCTQHVPDREQLWKDALQKHRDGELPTLLKSSMARLREVNFVQRLQTRLSNLNTLRHPLSDELITVQNWDALLEERDERSEIMKMMNKVVLDADWVSRTPLNISVYYQVESAGKQKNSPVGILVQVYSHSKAMLQQGFDTQPFGDEELLRFLSPVSEQAQKKQVFTLVMLAATSGWDEAARRLIRGDGSPGSAYSHRWLLVYLNDLEKHEVVYNRLDSHARAYAELFTTLLPDEEDEEMIVAIEKEMGIHESLTLQYAVQVLPYSQKSLERAFTKLAAAGRYVLTTVPEIGQAIVRK
ncbi:MAG: helix-turn-helix domain-containing protein [Anaerolineales bacterium]